jgi:hypothetical protein
MYFINWLKFFFKNVRREKNKKHRVGLNIPVKLGSSSILVKISYFVIIRKIGMIKNLLILTGILIGMGVIEIEYELNKINVFTKSDEEPHIPGIGGIMATGLSKFQASLHEAGMFCVFWSILGT